MSSTGTQAMVSGKKRHGKSYWVKKVLIPAMAKNKPVVIFDRKHEYGGRNAVDHSKKWNVYKSGSEFFTDVIEKGRISGVNVVLCSSDVDYNLMFNFFHRLERPVSLILDEAHDIFISDDFAAAKKAAVRLSRYGATFGVDTIWITHRTADLPRDIRYQFDWIVSFYQGSESDAKMIEEIGFSNGESVRSLKKREKILFSYLPDDLKIPESQFKQTNR